MRMGAYPNSLAELVPNLLPEAPIDPWSGKGLLYRRTEHGFILYSVGDNMQDDGGLVPEGGGAAPTGDLVLQIGN